MKLALRAAPFLAWLTFLLLLVLATDARAADPQPTTKQPASTPAATAQPASTPGASAPAATPPERLSFAVVIGNNKSLGQRRPDLHYADDDAARYFDIMQTIAPGRVSLLADFDRDTERLFPDARSHAATPTRRNLTTIGRRLAEQIRAAKAAGHETEVYFIFAGHGDVAQGEGFIEMSDARFRSSELKAWLKAIPFTRAHVILDSCNSFFMLGVRKPGGRHFATSEDAARALASQLSNVGVFLSTSSEGEAFEWSEIQGGIFSHVVRSGLLGSADANGDGAVSYLELAAFVDTATADVKNPNMRPHVFARGPGAKNDIPISRLLSMTAVHRFELSDASSLRIRLRDANGLPLLDAHTDRSMRLALAVPEAWARGSVIEREQEGPVGTHGRAPRKLYAVPELPETVKLAALSELPRQSSVRGPDETFEALFAQPFGPARVARYQAEQSHRPPPVYGVSKEDVQRMAMVLDVLAASERDKRIGEGLGGIAFGTLFGGVGLSTLLSDADDSDTTKTRIVGGALLGFGTAAVIGSTTNFVTTGKGEDAAAEFHHVLDSGGDPALAFAVADKRVRELVKEREAERLTTTIAGSIALVGCGVGLTLSEIAADEGESRMGPRLGWGAGTLLGFLMLGNAQLGEKPADAVTKIWRDDPSVNRLQPSLTLGPDGASLTLSGTL